MSDNNSWVPGLTLFSDHCPANEWGRYGKRVERIWAKRERAVFSAFVAEVKRRCDKRPHANPNDVIDGILSRYPK